MIALRIYRRHCHPSRYSIPIISLRPSNKNICNALWETLSPNGLTASTSRQRISTRQLTICTNSIQGSWDHTLSVVCPRETEPSDNRMAWEQVPKNLQHRSSSSRTWEITPMTSTNRVYHRRSIKAASKQNYQRIRDRALRKVKLHTQSSCLLCIRSTTETWVMISGSVEREAIFLLDRIRRVVASFQHRAQRISNCCTSNRAHLQGVS